MKKIFYLLAMACTIGTFTACTSEDDPTIWDTFHPQETHVRGERIDTTDNDITYEFLNYQVNVSRESDTQANVYITSYSSNGDENGIFIVKGAYIEQKGNNVVISGSTNDQQATNIQLTYSKEYYITLVETKDGKTNTLTNRDPTGLTTVAGKWTVSTTENPELAKVMSVIAFSENGKIYIKYAEPTSSEEGTTTTTQTTWKIADDLARYTVINHYHGEYKIGIILNHEKLLSIFKDEATQTLLQKIQENFKDGTIPVNLTFSNKEASVYLSVDEQDAPVFANTLFASGIHLDQ